MREHLLRAFKGSDLISSRSKNPLGGNANTGFIVDDENDRSIAAHLYFPVCYDSSDCPTPQDLRERLYCRAARCQKYKTRATVDTGPKSNGNPSMADYILSTRPA